MKTVAIIGAGPAGLSAAYTLLNQSNEYKITIFEKDSNIGGLSKTFEFAGGRLDIGGHRFFSKNTDVLNLWETVLPHGPHGMLVRNRKSHILWEEKLIEYPVQLNAQTINDLGITNGIKIIVDYIVSSGKTKSIYSLEDFYIRNFGRKLYSMFFENYTYKLWGIPANKLSSDWGVQRIQKVSLYSLIKSILLKTGAKDSAERSLITKYNYPSYGAGQLWDSLSEKIIEYGGHIELNCEVLSLLMSNFQIDGIQYQKNSAIHTEKFDYVISSMPLRDLILSTENSTVEIQQIARRLLYRDMIVLGVELPSESMGTSYYTAQKDSWIYIQDPQITFGRVQILNNWSPYATVSKDSILLELEFFCNEGDDLWEIDDESLMARSFSELIKCKLCRKNSNIRSYIVKRVEKAYPIYADGYYDLNTVENWLNKIQNLRCVGRNGQHCYYNMDHSVETGIEAAKSIFDRLDSRRFWHVNREQEYLER